MFACMAGAPPQPADQRDSNDRMPGLLAGLEKVYPRALVSTVRWCLELDPLRRPQSVFAAQRALREAGDEDPPESDARAPWLSAWLDTIAGRLTRRRAAPRTLTLDQ